MEAIVFIILQIFFATRAVLKIGEYHSDIPQLQLGNIERASENILWIIVRFIALGNVHQFQYLSEPISNTI